MREIKIDFNVDDTISSFRALLMRIFGAQAAEVSLVEDTVLDLSKCQYLGPLAVTALCGLRKWAGKRGVKLTLLPPQLEQLRAYCGYSGLLHAFELAPPPVPFAGSATTPVRQFSTLPLQAIEDIVQLMKFEMSMPSRSEDHLRLSLSELLQNVIDHSGSEVGGFVSSRAFHGKREVRFVVADMGEGFRRRLAKKYTLRTDQEAIKKSLEPGVSSKSKQRNMGLGLTHLVEVTKKNDGHLIIVSHQGRMLLNRGDFSFAKMLPAFPGSIACVSLNIPDASVDNGDGNAQKDIWE